MKKKEPKKHPHFYIYPSKMSEKERSAVFKEKEKAEQIYGISDKQLRSYVAKALKSVEHHEEYLLRKLETRLDNVLYLLGLAPDRQQAGQLIERGYVLVNRQRVDFPDYHVDKRDVIALDDTRMEEAGIVKYETSVRMPSWLERDNGIGTVKHFPHAHDLPNNLDARKVIEYFTSLQKSKDWSHFLHK